MQSRHRLAGQKKASESMEILYVDMQASSFWRPALALGRALVNNRPLSIVLRIYMTSGQKDREISLAKF